MIDRIVLKMGGGASHGSQQLQRPCAAHLLFLLWAVTKGRQFRNGTGAYEGTDGVKMAQSKTKENKSHYKRHGKGKSGTKTGISICRRRNIFRCFPRSLPLYATRNKSNDERSGTAFDSSRTFLPRSRIVSHTHTHTQTPEKRGKRKGMLLKDRWLMTPTEKLWGASYPSATSRVQARGWLLFTHFTINYPAPELSDESIIHSTRFHFTVSGAFLLFEMVDVRWSLCQGKWSASRSS